MEGCVKYSISLLKRAEPLALSYHKDGFHLAFSGGKDSQVMYDIALMAKVKFKAHMQLTTVDPPQLIRFVKERYPDVELHKPQMSMQQLILKKGMLPTRQSRFCCMFLKEQAGIGTVTLTGIRKEESVRRAKRKEIEGVSLFDSTQPRQLDIFDINTEVSHSCIGGNDKVIISPIFNWRYGDVWRHIRTENLNYCELYDKKFHRIGCVFCPMASVKNKVRERTLFPNFEYAYKKTIQKLMEMGKYDNFKDENEVFDWWISNKSVKEYLADKQQLKINFSFNQQ